MNSYGWTAIIYTFYHFGLTGIEVLEMLVEAGMDHTHRDLYGWNILHFAVSVVYFWSTVKVPSEQKSTISCCLGPVLVGLWGSLLWKAFLNHFPVPL